MTLRRRALLLSVFALAAAPARATDEGTVDFRAKNYRSDLEKKLTTAEGDVQVKFDGQIVEGDHVEIDGLQGRVRAKGNVRYVRGDLEIRGETADVDVRTGLGVFRNGVLRVGKSLIVEGKELEHYEKDRYRAIKAKISLCQDCPQSWSVTGSTVNVEFEGFATVEHALVQVRDTPLAYFPVIVFPVKTQRQSGFLFPSYAYQNYMGGEFRQPYFWAINPASDATIRYDYLSRGGQRMATEYRYEYSDRSWFHGIGSLLRSPREVRDLKGLESVRWGYSFDQRWQVTSRLTQRFRGELASDRFYTEHFPEDFASTHLPTLRNEASLAWQDGFFFAYGTMRLHQDNLPRNPDRAALINGASDPELYTGRGMIQSLPDTGFSLPATRLWGPILGSGDFRYLSLRRSGPSIDPDTGWIRTGDRGTLKLRVHAPLHPLSVLKWEPTVEAQADSYAFQSLSASRAAFRGRLVVDQRLSGDIFRVYQTDLGELRAIKHSITPVVRWSYSPPDARTRHPFFDGNQQADAPQFDLFDPKFDTATTQFGTFSEEQRLRHHHLMTYGVESRLVGRYGLTSKSYEEFLGVTLNRDFDLLASDWGDIRLNAFGAYGPLRLSTEITINTSGPSGPTANLRNEFAYRNTNFYGVLSQQLSPGVETYGVGTELRFLRPWSVSAAGTYSAVTKRPQTQAYTLGFDGGASKCFFLSLAFANDPGDPTQIRFSKVMAGFLVTDDLKAATF